VAVVRLNALIVTLAMSGIVTGGTLLWAGVSFSLSGTSRRLCSTWRRCGWAG